VSAEPLYHASTARRISIGGGEGNALYPVLSGCLLHCHAVTANSQHANRTVNKPAELIAVKAAES